MSVHVVPLLGLLVGFVGLLFYISCSCLSPISGYVKQRGDDDEVIFLHSMVIGALLWGVVWWMLIGFEVFETVPALLMPFFWPILLTLFQIIDTHYDRCEDIQPPHAQRQQLILGIRADTGTIISTSFAIGTLLVALGRTSAHTPPIRLVVVVLLLGIGFIVPTHYFVNNNQRYTVFVRVLQRMIVNYSIGFIMAALVLIWNHAPKTFVPHGSTGNPTLV